jgi:hypothetical protein
MSSFKVVALALLITLLIVGMADCASAETLSGPKSGDESGSDKWYVTFTPDSSVALDSSEQTARPLVLSKNRVSVTARVMCGIEVLTYDSLEIAIARLIPGRPLNFRWSGLTDPGNGEARIEIAENRGDATGDYVIIAKGQQSTRLLGLWRGVPIRSGVKNYLCLFMGQEQTSPVGQLVLEPWDTLAVHHEALDTETLRVTTFYLMAIGEAVRLPPLPFRIISSRKELSRVTLKVWNTFSAGEILRTPLTYSVPSVESGAVLAFYPGNLTLPEGEMVVFELSVSRRLTDGTAFIAGDYVEAYLLGSQGMARGVSSRQSVPIPSAHLARAVFVSDDDQ